MRTDEAVSIRCGMTFLVLHAGSDGGYRIARELLAAGCRVAVTSRFATDLARVLTGYSAQQVLAIAAEDSQLDRVISRVERRWGPINAIVDAAHHVSVPVEAA